MKLLKTNNGPDAIVDDEDFERLSVFSWTWHQTGIDRSFLETSKKRIYVCIANQVMQNFESTFDHKDRNFLNNQKENLRTATRYQNNCNREGWGLSKYKGVDFSKGKYRARIQYKKKCVSIGAFDTAEEAARAYDLKAIELQGEFACLNFPL